MSRDFVLDDNGAPVRRTLTVGDSTITEVLMHSINPLGGAGVEDWIRVNGEAGIAELKSQIESQRAEEEIKGDLHWIELMQSDQSFRTQFMKFNNCTEAQAAEAIANVIANLPADRRLHAAETRPAPPPAAPAPVIAQQGPLSIEAIKASLTPAEITAAEARAASAVAKVRHEQIASGWQKVTARIGAEQSGKSTVPNSWARTIAKFTPRGVQK